MIGGDLISGFSQFIADVENKKAELERKRDNANREFMEVDNQQSRAEQQYVVAKNELANAVLEADGDVYSAPDEIKRDISKKADELVQKRSESLDIDKRIDKVSEKIQELNDEITKYNNAIEILNKL